MYQCSERSRAIAQELDIIPSINFIQSMERGGCEYIRPTAGKPNEMEYLKRQALAAGFIAGPEGHFGNGHWYPRYYRRTLGAALTRAIIDAMA
jgi:hypothetical protein